MSAELKIVEPTVLTQQERAELDANIESLIAASKDNRQEINRLVFESVSAMTAGDDYERQLAERKGIRRFVGMITGSNRKLREKISSNRAAAQYASQQTLQRLAEQNLMTFDLITAVNNKLNASVLGVEKEINEIYGILVRFFKQSKTDMVQMENRVEQLERNVNLLKWVNSIEYLDLDGVEYSELDDPSKIVCLVRDFYEKTDGNWTTSDLLLLKTTMKDIDISPKESIDYYSFIDTVAGNERLKEYLLGSKQIAQLPESYMVPLLGMKKLELLDGEEAFVVNTVQASLTEGGVAAERQDLTTKLTKNYLKQQAQVNVDVQVNHYDLMLELLFNLKAAESAGILLSQEEVEKETEVEPAEPTQEEPAEPSEEELREQEYQKVAELFKNCRLKEAHPLLVKLSNEGEARANGLLYWLLQDGYEGFHADEDAAKKYAQKGYQAGDSISALQYALFVCERGESRKAICEKYRPKVQQQAETGDAFALYMLGICYLNETDAPANCSSAVDYFYQAAAQKFYRAYYAISLRYYKGEGVGKDYDTAMKWACNAAKYPQYIKPIKLQGDICYDKEGNYSGRDLCRADAFYTKYREKGGTEDTREMRTARKVAVARGVW